MNVQDIFIRLRIINYNNIENILKTTQIKNLI